MKNNSEEKPILSVVIPCYNYGHLVHETLENLKQQTYNNWECIVVNDGSTDGTEEVVLGYVATDPRFKYIYQKNRGMSVARNKGIREAAGKYIQLLDSDDLLEPEKFSFHIDFLENNLDVDIVYGDVKYFYTDSLEKFYKTVDATQKDWMPKVSGCGEVIITSLIKTNIMAINCPVIRKNVFQRAGLFNENLRHIEDWEMFLRWAMNGISFYYLNIKNTDALVRMHSISVSRDKWNMRYHELELKEYLMKQRLDVALTGNLSYEVDKLRISLLLIALLNFFKGDFSKAVEQYKRTQKKFALVDLRKNGGKILLEKARAFLYKR